MLFWDVPRTAGLASSFRTHADGALFMSSPPVFFLDRFGRCVGERRGVPGVEEGCQGARGRRRGSGEEDAAPVPFLPPVLVLVAALDSVPARRGGGGVVMVVRRSVRNTLLGVLPVAVAMAMVMVMVGSGHCMSWPLRQGHAHAVCST